MKYDLIAIFNPLKEDYIFEHGGEGYLIPSKGIRLFPFYMKDIVVKTIVNQVLWSRGKEIDDSKRAEIEAEVLSHKEFEIVDLTGKKAKAAKDDNGAGDGKEEE